jgi:hypothetical protein
MTKPVTNAAAAMPVEERRLATMNNNLFVSCDWLRGQNNRGYGRLPIPQPRDSEISKLLRAWIALDEVDRNQSALEISDEQRPTLLAYSERMASLAVRERNQEFIILGLIALGVDGWRFDWRDNVLIVSLHFEAAERISASPEAIFAAAAQWLPEQPARGLRAFLGRSAHDKSLGAMGYVAGKDEGGFRYQRTW